MMKARISEAVEFLKKLRPKGPWVLTAIHPDNGWVKTITASTENAVAAFITEYDGKRNLYYSVNPTRTAMDKKAKKTDIAAIEFNLADLDPNDDETSEAGKQRYLQQLNGGSFQPAPTCGLDSGNGVQCLWRLDEPLVLGEPVWVAKGKKRELVFSPEDQAKIDDAEARTRAVMVRLGAKPGTQNIDRVLRLPGTINLPNAKKRKAGRVPCRTKLLWFKNTRHPPSAFPKDDEAKGPEPQKEEAAQVEVDPFEELAREQESEVDESGSGYGYRFMQGCHDRGMSYERAHEAILADEHEAGEWANRAGERQLRRAWENSKPEVRKEKKKQKSGAVVMVCAAEVVMRSKQWLWEGHLLRAGLELTTGLPGLGKSQLQIHFMACASAGLPWPDGAAASDPVNVIMVTAEDAIDTEVVPRLTAAGADLKRIFILQYIKTDQQQRQFLLNEDLERLEREIARIGDVGLVCIDPITAYMGGKVDAHKTTEVRSQLGPLKDFSERTNVALSAITHPAKNASAKAIDHFIGSQAFIASARVGHACFEEFEDGEERGEKVPTGRILFTNVKYSAHTKMPTLAYKIESVDIEPEPYLRIATSRVVFEKDAVNVSAEQAIAAARSSGKGKQEEEASNEVTDFLRTMITGSGGWCKTTEVMAQAKMLGFSDKELRTARKKLHVESRRVGGLADDGWWEWGWDGVRF